MNFPAHNIDEFLKFQSPHLKRVNDVRPAQGGFNMIIYLYGYLSIRDELIMVTL